MGITPYSPKRVGPYGLLQPIADGIKLFFKEDVTPANVDKLIYFIAPAMALFRRRLITLSWAIPSGSQWPISTTTTSPIWHSADRHFWEPAMEGL